MEMQAIGTVVAGGASGLGHPLEYARPVKSTIGNPMLNGEVIRLDRAIRVALR